MTAKGSCFGYSIHSEQPFAFLRDGPGETDLHVAVGDGPEGPLGDVLLEWSPPVFPFAARLHGAAPRFDLWVEAAGWFGIDTEAGRITVPADAPEPRREERLWGMPSVLCFMARGDLPLHAAAVEIGGAALALAAPSRYGKTTLAAALVSAGHRLLAEDLACIRLDQDAAVIPGPAMLRVRVDIADHLDLSGTVRLARGDDRVHLALDPTRRGSCDPVPLRGVVLLREHDDLPQLEPVEASQALADLWTVSFKLPTDDDRGRAFTRLADLTRAVPVHDLHRPQRLEALAPTVALLEDLARA